MRITSREQTTVLLEQARASLAAFPPDEAALWIDKFDELENECGCAVGARFFFAALLAYSAIWYWLIRPNHASLWYGALIGFVVLFLAAGLGKLTGILIARSSLRRTARSLLARLKERHGGANG